MSYEKSQFVAVDARKESPVRSPRTGHMIDWVKRWYPHFMVWSPRLSPTIRTPRGVRVLHSVARRSRRSNVSKHRQVLVLMSGSGSAFAAGLHGNAAASVKSA